ncbi:hypothetical protein ATO13_12196 [Stappia sp. 22II-S9-Z10]|nr:hypothetical protein ATO13_12196 [Stappia sp. 22II-S9-Z10]
MKPLLIGGLAAMAALASLEAAAQSFGDTQTSYLNGVVYDDDLVPGRGPNVTYDGGDTVQDSLYGATRNVYTGRYATVERYNRRQNSANLIGRDGRLTND